MCPQIVHHFGEGKYTVIFDEATGSMHALRYDDPEPWRDLTGDGMVLAMLQDYAFLQEQSAIGDQQIESLLSEVKYLRDRLDKEIHSGGDDWTDNYPI